MRIDKWENKKVKKQLRKLCDELPSRDEDGNLIPAYIFAEHPKHVVLILPRETYNLLAKAEATSLLKHSITAVFEEIFKELGFGNNIMFI